ncbi:beta-galactosidase 3-like isoform X2 [Bidens hawaiensis]|uniref:beta-galactosidase 3-like isoform X2 n=1 Tax=Bidens hawaiensis TaxID=980011 RepID=UPI00404AE04C
MSSNRAFQQCPKYGPRIGPDGSRHLGAEIRIVRLKMLLIRLLGFSKKEEVCIIIICITVGQISGVRLAARSSPQVMIMMHRLMNTVGSQTSNITMLPEKLKNNWEIFVEKAGIWGKADFTRNGFVDHINTTKDTADYFWHTTRLLVDQNEKFLTNGIKPTLVIESKGHALHAFVNGILQASGSGNGTVSPFTFKSPVSLKAGYNEIAILSMTMGLQNAGSFYEWVGAGLTSAKLEGIKNGTVDLTSTAWTYKIGLEGERLRIYNADGAKNVKWTKVSEPPKNQPLTWYKAIVDAPPGDEPIGLDMVHMGKGLAWLNGEQIGRYWPRKAPFDKCVKTCDYRGKFNPDKCNRGCGEPTQRWYHVPRSWFKPSGNVLVIFEEKGGDPTQISFSRRKVSALCAHVSEDHPSFVTDNMQNIKPRLELKCPNNTHISGFKFASYRTPTGTCQSYAVGDCHDPDSISILEKLCLNKNECVVELSEEHFKTELCPDKTETCCASNV